MLLRNLDVIFHTYQRFAYEAIMYIITRREFDLAHLQLVDGRPSCPKVHIILSSSLFIT